MKKDIRRGWILVMVGVLLAVTIGCGIGSTEKSVSGNDVSLQKVIERKQLILGSDVGFPPMGFNNAVKYTEEGSVIFHIDYEKVPEEADMVYLNFSVKDTGIGIKSEDMGKLFSKLLIVQRFWVVKSIGRSLPHRMHRFW